MSRKYITDKDLEDILARSDDSGDEYEDLSNDDSSGAEQEQVIVTIWAIFPKCAISLRCFFCRMRMIQSTI